MDYPVVVSEYPQILYLSQGVCYENIMWFGGIVKGQSGGSGWKGCKPWGMIGQVFQLPPGFVVTSAAYYKASGRQHPCEFSPILSNLDAEDSDSPTCSIRKNQDLIIEGKISRRCENDILNYYKRLL